MATTQNTAPAQNRYRVTFREELIYTIDVLAADGEQAGNLAFEFVEDTKAKCIFFDVEHVEDVPEHDDGFQAANADRSV